MPFVVWIVPNKVLDKTAGYIERTERRFPTKELLNQFSKLKKK